LGDELAEDPHLVAGGEQLEAERERLLAPLRLVDELRQVEVRRDGERAVVDEELADRADSLDVAGRVIREGMADVDAATPTRLDATAAHQLGGGVVQAVQHLGVGLARVVAAVIEAPRPVLATSLREAAEERVADL